MVLNFDEPRVRSVLVSMNSLLRASALLGVMLCRAEAIYYQEEKLGSQGMYMWWSSTGWVMACLQRRVLR